MANVKIFIKNKITDPNTGDTRTEVKATIINREAIPAFQRVFGVQVSKIVPVDDEGNEIAGKAAPVGTPKERALEAMRQKGKDLGIKGWAIMKEDVLLKKIQDVYNKK